MLRGLLAGYPPWAAGLIPITVALVLAYVVAEAMARGAQRVMVRFIHADEQRTSSTMVRPLRVVRLSTLVVVFLVLLFPALKVGGLDTQVGFEPEAVAEWLLGSGLRIVVVLVLAMLVMRVTGMAVRRIEEEIGRGHTLDALERAKRVNTLGTVVENVVGVFAGVSAVLMILRELNVDVLPLLTGAGIVGLAIGFGAQSLVKDVISGFFMILENQVRVGDVAVINGVSGVVETMKLRTISLRDVEGAVHVFPNGSINTLANKSKDFSYAVLNIVVAYREDTDRVIDVLRQVGEEVRQDARLTSSILEPLEVLGIESIADANVTLKIRFKTLPLRQWDVAREMRRQIKKAFEASGIAMPAPPKVFQIVSSEDAASAATTAAASAQAGGETKPS